MSDIRTSYKRAARIQTVVCGLLFSIFAFVYLYVFQQDVLEAFHYSLAHGKTHFAPFASAFIITLLLIALRWATNFVLGLKGDVRAWAYFPSCLVLGVLTDVGRGLYTEEYHTRWLWLFPLVLVLYFGFTIVLRQLVRMRPISWSAPLQLFNSNVLILFVLCMMSVWVGNTNRELHHELQAERFMRAHQYNKVLAVGAKSPHATRTLTALRTLAMAREGTMGEKLFQYPQYYHSDGLFFDTDSLKTLRYTNDSLYYLLGVRPAAGETHAQLLKNICYKGTGRHVALDYYMASLLLDKRLDDFRHAVTDFYEPEDTLPRYYQEAALLSGDTALCRDSSLFIRFKSYNERKKDRLTPAEERKNMRKEFGDTYWWYFHYQK